MSKSWSELIAASSIGEGLRELAEFHRAQEEKIRRALPCKCSVQHSVAKLGHSRACPHHGVAPPEMPIVLMKPGCPPRHADGTEHDYGWATYDDEHESYGVCRCGHSAMDAAWWGEP